MATNKYLDISPSDIVLVTAVLITAWDKQLLSLWVWSILHRSELSMRQWVKLAKLLGVETPKNVWVFHLLPCERERSIWDGPRDHRKQGLIRAEVLERFREVAEPRNGCKRNPEVE